MKRRILGAIAVTLPPVFIVLDTAQKIRISDTVVMGLFGLSSLGIAVLLRAFTKE